VRNSLYQIVNLIAWVCREQGLDSEDFSKESLIAQFNELPFLGLFREWLFDVIDLYGESVAERKIAVNVEFLDSITDYIRLNLQNEISLQSVAEAFSISRSHLSRIFKEGKGMSFQDFVVSEKFVRAAELLVENADESITVISRSLGYFDLAYFSKLFKARYGMTPSQYRKQHRTVDPLHRISTDRGGAEVNGSSESGATG